MKLTDIIEAERGYRKKYAPHEVGRCRRPHATLAYYATFDPTLTAALVRCYLAQRGFMDEVDGECRDSVLNEFDNEKDAAADAVTAILRERGLE